MNIERQSPYSNSIMAELGQWSRQEETFRHLFSDQALNDRDFKKMKLAEYERIFRSYRGYANTTDEKALMTMLRFQRKKLQKAVYPRRISRMAYKLKQFLKSPLDRKAELEKVRRDTEAYATVSIPVPEQKKHQPLQHRKYYGPDLGRRQQSKGQHKGQRA